MEKKTDREPGERDDIEQFIDAEKEKTAAELKDIQAELEKLTRTLGAYVEVLDQEIKEAFENGDDKAWISLTGKKSLLLQRLSELTRIIAK